MKRLLLLLLLCCSFYAAHADSRDYIREKIRDWGECKNVAITKTNGDLALYGKNGWAGSGLPSALSNALHELHDNDELIADVCLTENGRWLILYGNNGFRWDGIPYSLENKLREYNANNEVVLSVSFNDSGDWILIGEDHYSASSTEISNWLKNGANKHGMLWSVCVTNDGIVACYENGFQFLGEYPDMLKSRLIDADFDVYRIKIAGDAFFFADKYGRYDYRM